MDEKKLIVPEKKLWTPNNMPKIEEVLARLNNNQPPMLALPPPRS